MTTLVKMLTALTTIVQLLTDLLRAYRFSHKIPGMMYFKVTGRVQTSLAGDRFMLEGVISFGGAASEPHVTRQFTYTVNDGEPIVKNYETSDTQSDKIQVAENSAIKAELIDIDATGNQSVPRTLEFVATDNVAPDQPGELGFRFNTVEDTPPPSDVTTQA